MGREALVTWILVAHTVAFAGLGLEYGGPTTIEPVIADGRLRDSLTQVFPMSMSMDAVDRIGVVGAGTMGSGIAQVAAAAGFDVTIRDVDDSLVDDGLEAVESGLDRAVDRGELTQSQATAARERVHGTTDLSDLADCQLCIEAVVEDLRVKRDVLADLDRMTASDVILGTNTSTLSITALAAATDRPSQVIGIHFMNPVPRMRGVEIVVGERTAPFVVELGHEFAAALDKETWESDDKPGFVTNRILMPWINEGIRAYDEGVASKADIDRGMELGTNVPMGPLALADHIGLDICLHASQTLHDELGERFRPAYLLARKVEAGDLGKKTGRGFYEYD